MIEINNVSKTYGKKKVVNDLSLNAFFSMKSIPDGSRSSHTIKDVQTFLRMW